MPAASANSDSHLHKLVSYDGQFSSIISNSIRVSRHIALRHRKESKYRCDKCLRVFRNATSLTQHNFKIHGVVNPKLKVRCIIVRTRYQFHMLLTMIVLSAIKIQQKTNVHVQVLRELVASTANYVIRLSDILLFFIMVQYFKCPDCDFTAFTAKCVEKHQIKHTDIRDIRCDYCSRMFKTIKYVLAPYYTFPSSSTQI